MAKTRQEKEQALSTLVSSMKEAKGVAFANFQGLKMEEINELRSKCREEGIQTVASKKTLVTLALKELGIDVDAKQFGGGVQVFFGNTDEVAPAKVVADFAKAHEAASFFGGVLEGKFIDADGMKALSSLPSKQQLLGQLVGTINAPVSGFVNVLAGNLRGLVTVLNAVKDKQAA